MALCGIFCDTVAPYVRKVMGAWWVGFVGYFAPIAPLVKIAMIFICLDFVIGCIASHKRVTQAGKRWYFRSSAAWLTLYKAGFCAVTIGALYIVTNDVLGDVEFLSTMPNIFCAMVCGTELWSFCENAAYISESRVFLWVRKYAIKKANKYDDMISEEIIEEATKPYKDDK